MWFFDRKSVELAKDDINQLYFILMTNMKCTKDFPKSILDNLITRLANLKNSCVDQVLGIYYLKHEKVCYLLNNWYENKNICSTICFVSGLCKSKNAFLSWNGCWSI